MKVLTLIFTCLTCAFNIIDAASYQATPQDLKGEYEVAIDVSRNFQKGMLSKEQANEILMGTFSDYSHTGGKFATIAHFVQKTIGLENPVIHTSSEQRGWSGSEVYSIHMESLEEAQFFVKIFPYDSKRYLPEIFGLALMREIQEVDSPKVCACGQCFIDENRYFLVLETAVKGLSIQQYYIKVGQCQIGSHARNQALKELCEAVQLSGIGLAKFHHHYPNKKQTFPKNVEEAVRQDLSHAIEALTVQPVDGIDIDKLQALTEYVLVNVNAEEHLIGLAYDDIKTVHAFYECRAKKFSLVNPDRLNLSFNEEGELQGLPAKDVCKFVLSLKLNRFQYSLIENLRVSRVELLTEEEIKNVIKSFELGYTQGGGVLPSLAQKECVSLQHDLFFIKNSHRDFQEPELTRVKDLVNISLENIKIQLSQMI